MNNVVPGIDEWAAASACTEPGRLAGVEPGAAALASADPCRGLNGGRDVGHGSLSLLFTGHPGPWPIAWPHQLLLTAQKRKPPRPHLPALCSSLPIYKFLAASTKKPRARGRAQLIYPAPARERVRSSRRYVARAGRFFCSARRWMPRAGPLGGRNVCGARATRKIIAARRSLIRPQA